MPGVETLTIKISAKFHVSATRAEIFLHRLETWIWKKLLAGGEKKSWVGFETIMSDIWRRVGSDAWRHRRWLTAAGLSGSPRSKKDFLMSEVNSSTLELVDTSWSTPHFMTRPEKLLTSCWPRRRRSTWQSTSWKVDGPFRNKVWMI